MSSGRYELIGAVSWGRNCAKSYGVYADVPCKISHFYLLVPGNCVLYSATISYYSLYFATYFRLPPVGDRNSGHSLHCLASGSAWNQLKLQPFLSIAEIQDRLTRQNSAYELRQQIYKQTSCRVCVRFNFHVFKSPLYLIIEIWREKKHCWAVNHLDCAFIPLSFDPFHSLARALGTSQRYLEYFWRSRDNSVHPCQRGDGQAWYPVGRSETLNVDGR